MLLLLQHFFGFPVQVKGEDLQWSPLYSHFTMEAKELMPLLCLFGMAIKHAWRYRTVPSSPLFSKRKLLYLLINRISVLQQGGIFIISSQGDQKWTFVSYLGIFYIWSPGPLTNCWFHVNITINIPWHTHQRELVAVNFSVCSPWPLSSKAKDQ